MFGEKRSHASAFQKLFSPRPESKKELGTGYPQGPLMEKYHSESSDMDTSGYGLTNYLTDRVYTPEI